MTLRQASRTLLTLLALALVGLSAWCAMKLSEFPGGAAGKFDGQRTLRDVQYQTSLGPRTPGSPAYHRIVVWMRAELKSAGWQAEFQGASLMGHPLQNVVARQSDQPPQIILAAHYDSRLALLTGTRIQANGPQRCRARTTALRAWPSCSNWPAHCQKTALRSG